jgi:hypothetical protein
MKMTNFECKCATRQFLYTCIAMCMKFYITNLHLNFLQQSTYMDKLQMCIVSNFPRTLKCVV